MVLLTSQKRRNKYCFLVISYNCSCVIGKYVTVSLAMKIIVLLVKLRKLKLCFFIFKRYEQETFISWLNKEQTLYSGTNSVKELVPEYKYLGFIFDESLSFKSHVNHLQANHKLKLGSHFRNKAYFYYGDGYRFAPASF